MKGTIVWGGIIAGTSHCWKPDREAKTLEWATDSGQPHLWTSLYLKCSFDIGEYLSKRNNVNSIYREDYDDKSGELSRSREQIQRDKI